MYTYMYYFIHACAFVCWCVFLYVCVCVRARACVLCFIFRCFCGTGDISQSQKPHKKSWQYVEEKLRGVMDPTLPLDSLRRSALYWLHWNRLVEQNYPNATRVRLEESRLKLQDILHGLGLTDAVVSDVLRTNVLQTDSGKQALKNSKAHKSPDTAKDRVPDVTWRELHMLDPVLAGQVLEQAQRYGYEVGIAMQDLI